MRVEPQVYILRDDLVIDSLLSIVKSDQKTWVIFFRTYIVRFFDIFKKEPNIWQNVSLTKMDYAGNYPFEYLCNVRRIAA